MPNHQARTPAPERVVLYARIAAETYEQLVQTAESDRRKIAATAEILLEEALAARRAKADPDAWVYR